MKISLPLLSCIVNHDFLSVVHFIMINCDIIYIKVFSKQLVKYTNCKEHLLVYVSDRSLLSSMSSCYSSIKIFGSDRSPRCQNVVCACVRDIMLKNTLIEF